MTVRAPCSNIIKNLDSNSRELNQTQGSSQCRALSDHTQVVTPWSWPCSVIPTTGFGRAREGEGRGDGHFPRPCCARWSVYIIPFLPHFTDEETTKVKAKESKVTSPGACDWYESTLKFVPISGSKFPLVVCWLVCCFFDLPFPHLHSKSSNGL